MHHEGCHEMGGIEVGKNIYEYIFHLYHVYIWVEICFIYATRHNACRILSFIHKRHVVFMYM